MVDTKNPSDEHAGGDTPDPSGSIPRDKQNISDMDELHIWATLESIQDRTRELEKELNEEAVNDVKGNINRIIRDTVSRLNGVIGSLHESDVDSAIDTTSPGDASVLSRGKIEGVDGIGQQAELRKQVKALQKKYNLKTNEMQYMLKILSSNTEQAEQEINKVEEEHRKKKSKEKESQKIDDKTEDEKNDTEKRTWTEWRKQTWESRKYQVYATTGSAAATATGATIAWLANPWIGIPIAAAGGVYFLSGTKWGRKAFGKIWPYINLNDKKYILKP
ncbi:MAG: hypothetical protein WCX29_03900 [Candidatus Peribacteraceae bacterium]